MQLERNATSQDVSWFLDLYNQEKLDLNPSYQRKSVWNDKDKEFYIDTVINNYPCPAVFLYKDIDNNGSTTYRVIDGKQRLTAIIEFSNDKFSYSKESDNTELVQKYFSELSPEYKKNFWNYSIPIEQVNTDNSDVIKSIFDRLNRNNKKLTRQELRNARYDGELYQFVFNESLKEFWGKYVSIGQGNKARMEDEQFIAEIVLLTIAGTTQGFNQDKLDELYSGYDEIFEEKELVKETFRKIQQYISSLEDDGTRLDKYFSTRVNFYTLWNFILINWNNLPDTNVFLDKLNDIASKRSLSPNELVNFPSHLKYYENTKGAATDKKQRELRLNAMQEVIYEI